MVSGIRSVDRSAFSRVFRILSWAFARQESVLSGVLWSPVSVQLTDQHSLGCSGYCPGRSPDRRAFCRVFCGFRYPFSRQMGVLSGVSDTVLGVRPTEEHPVGYCAVFGICSVDRTAFSQVSGIPSWADARQRSLLSGISWFPVSIQSTDERTLWYSGYCPGRSPDRRAFCLVFCGFRFSFSRQISILSGVSNTVLG